MRTGRRRWFKRAKPEAGAGPETDGDPPDGDADDDPPGGADELDDDEELDDEGEETP